MNRTQTSLRAQERKQNRVLMVAFTLVLFIGVISQIAMMARLSRQNKQVARAESEIYELETRISNLELSISQHHDLERITARALELGMQMPDETQLRVVNLPALNDITSTQSADNTGAEEMMD